MHTLHFIFNVKKKKNVVNVLSSTKVTQTNHGHLPINIITSLRNIISYICVYVYECVNVCVYVVQ